MALARYQVVSTLQQWRTSHAAVETAALITSELATNAVRHTDGDHFGVAVTRAAGLITVAVTDAGRADTGPRSRPRGVSIRPGSPAHEEEDGRGLLLVTRLADCWGSRIAQHGHTVWARIPAHGGRS
ncbi:ATP-binding protein [Streptomyces sp. GKU 257-1]|nr:ATP-binding protein [Streptomyces sp. GKU 257-1]